ncbi:uncharacterized protein LOC133825149 [Humulus lupulus]|uniref:uncharacterized protein LOC133825149 n=1 Tax=Humulus lupulus TaxID=3486 RepID=UPI002B40F954|nr:uncharacterized protein LOC133825149 [Humulus lupulus]
MARKKKGLSKPVVSDEVVEDLPSIQDEVPVMIPDEEFHDPCDELELERGVELNRVGNVNRSSPYSVSWAEEAKGSEFQRSAKDVWSNFKSNQVLTPSTRLNYTEPLKMGDQIVARLDMEEVETEASFWKNAIVCIVLGANPPFRVFEGFVKRIWGNLGVDKIVRMHSGFTLVNFKDEATRDLILETGVIHFDKKPVVLRPWTPDMDSVRMVRSVPVWIRLNGLGLQYWGKNSLSAMVSTIGRPVMVDKVTQSRSMVKYARILVDMEISDHPPKSISFINERDQLVEQLVEYEWLPSKCAACSNLGHIMANCNKNNGLSWKKKSSVENGAKLDKIKVNSEEVIQQPSGVVSLVSREDKSSSYEEEGRTSRSLEQKQVGTGSSVDAGNWITPKRRGSRQGMADSHKSDIALARLYPEMVMLCYRILGPIVSGRILVLWQAKFVKVDILLEDPQLVHCRIRVSGQQTMFFATVVYGSNSMGERKKLWDKLASIGQLKFPWIIFGDFNAMFSYQDRNGGRQILAKDIADAQDWLALGQVEELKCAGAQYTWSNKHEAGDRIFSKLDRVFINELWLEEFPKTVACFKWDCISDHSFYVIRSQEVNKVGFIPFRFGNHWTQYRGFRDDVLCCWNAPVGSGGGLNKVVKKLFRVKHMLKRFNREEVGDVVLNYREAKEEFSRVQEALAANPTDLSLHQIVTQAQHKVSVLQNRYASYLKQQSKLNWLKFSDENSRFFHAFMRKRRVDNRITSFSIGGKIEEDFPKVVEHFLSHFKNLLGRRSWTSKEIDINYIGDEISTAVLDFFQDGYLPKELNEIVISLIPKIVDPSSASDYRPIACCNTL